MIKVILSLFLPLCCNTLKHCLLATSQILAVQSLDPDIKIEPSMDNERLVTCLLKNTRKNLTNNMRYEITFLFFFLYFKSPTMVLYIFYNEDKMGLGLFYLSCGFGVVLVWFKLLDKQNKPCLVRYNCLPKQRKLMNIRYLQN